MKRLDRYIGLTVAVAIAMTAFSLVGIMTLFTFLEEMEDVRNDYNFAQVVRYVLFSMPRLFYESIPYAALIGCLAGVGIMANNGELIVMRAAGISIWSITWSALKPALVLIMLSLMVGELILPDFERMARVDRMRAISDANVITPEAGIWYREGNIYMHFDVVGESGVLEGVTHFEVDDDNSLIRAMYARRAVFHSEGGESWWMLQETINTELKGDRIEVREEAERVWRTTLTPNLISTEIAVQPDKMSIGELYAKIGYMRTQELNSSKFELGFWAKVLQPLATIGLVLVGISFVFGPLREVSMGMRLVSGVIIGVLFGFVQDLLSPASLVFGFPPVVGIILPIAVCFILGCYLIRRAN